MDSRPDLAELARRLRDARSVVVLTGAGISAESGIPTFREARTGIWAGYDPERVASRAGFRRDPGLVWDWYAQRRAQIAAAEPNAGHRALAEIERRARDFDLLTQNIDGLHRAAGSRRVIELHGNIHRLKCFDRNHPADLEAAGSERPPRCPRCGSLLRPDVVWFGETLDLAAIGAAVDALRVCDLFLSVGTSGLVEPAASLAFEARAGGAFLAEINLESTPLSPYCDLRLEGRAGSLLPALLAEAWPASSLEAPCA